MNKLRIRTKDNKEYNVDQRIAELSVTINNWFESSDDPLIIDISSEVFEKVLQYCEMHNYNPPKIQKPIKSN
jgi:hypothetical protein